MLKCGEYESLIHSNEQKSWKANKNTKLKKGENTYLMYFEKAIFLVQNLCICSQFSRKVLKIILPNKYVNI